jgi:predicted RNA binding protein YcfA (HicA-like mRNA interferase family)
VSKRFPAVTSKQVLRIITRLGFAFSRQAGTSHAIYRRASDGRRTVVPMHAGTIIKRKTLKAILVDVGLSAEEFRKLITGEE